MIIRPFYLLFGLLVLGAAGAADVRGWFGARPTRRAGTSLNRSVTIQAPTARSTPLAPLRRREVDHGTRLSCPTSSPPSSSPGSASCPHRAFVAIDRLTPYTLWKEIIDDHNTALAILIGALALGMSIIVAAAIH